MMNNNTYKVGYFSMDRNNQAIGLHTIKILDFLILLLNFEECEFAETKSQGAFEDSINITLFIEL